MPEPIPPQPLWTWLGDSGRVPTTVLVRWTSDDGASHLSTLSVETDEVVELAHETGERLDVDTLDEVTRDVARWIAGRDATLNTDGSLKLERALLADFAAFTMGAV